MEIGEFMHNGENFFTEKPCRVLCKGVNLLSNKKYIFLSKVK